MTLWPACPGARWAPLASHCHATALVIEAAPSPLGAASVEVQGALGRTDADIDDLVRRGIVRCTPHRLADVSTHMDNGESG